jgi:hypothetical protein
LLEATEGVYVTYRKALAFGLLAALVAPVGDDDPSKARSDFLEKRNRELEGMAVEQLRARVGSLEKDLYDQREKNRELKAVAEKVKDFDVMAKELEAYRALGKPEELTGKLQELTTASTTLEQYRMAELVAGAAKTTKLEFDLGGKKESRAVNAEKLAHLVKLHGLKLEMRDGLIADADGKPVAGKVAHVLLEGGKSKALGEYISTDPNLATFADWVAEPPNAAKPTGGTPVVPQPSGSTQQPPAASDPSKEKRSSETYQF